METPTADAFAPHLNKRVRPLGQRHVLTLVAVHAEARPDRGEGARAPFLLLLRGPADEVLPDGLYALAIEDGPTFDLYVSPVHTPSRAHQDYQVVVN